MKIRSTVVIVLPILASLSCGSQPKYVASQTPDFDESSKPIEVPYPGSRRIHGRIARTDMNAVLDAGLSAFFRTIQVSANVKKGKLVGYTIVKSAAPLDLQPGDVVTRINGLQLDKPENAQVLWQELRVASELRVDFLRSGSPLCLRYAIDD